jgi:hypothetical protein
MAATVRSDPVRRVVSGPEDLHAVTANDDLGGCTVPNADQLLARLYALRKDYADDPEDETYLALHHAFLFISYNMAAFKDYVAKEAEKEDKGE